MNVLYYYLISVLSFFQHLEKGYVNNTLMSIIYNIIMKSLFCNTKIHVHTIR